MAQESCDCFTFECDEDLSYDDASYCETCSSCASDCNVVRVSPQLHRVARATNLRELRSFDVSVYNSSSDLYAPLIKEDASKRRRTCQNMGIEKINPGDLVLTPENLARAALEHEREGRPDEAQGTLLSDPKLHATAISAASGAVALGAAGGIFGTVAGSALGATVGVLAAPFTFGLSFPVCTFVGGSTGLCTGMVAGSGAGFMGGVAVGGGLAYRNDIQRCLATSCQLLPVLKDDEKDSA